MAVQPGLTGRKLRFRKGLTIAGSAWIGAKQDDVSILNSEVDVTDKDSGGYRTLLNDWGTRSIDVSVAGILKSEELITLVRQAAGALLLPDYNIDISGIGLFVGKFYLNNLQLGSPHDNAVTFSGTFLSSGAYTFTATP